MYMGHIIHFTLRESRPFRDKWLCQYNGGERVDVAAPERLVIPNNAMEMEVMARTNSVSVSCARRTPPLHLPESQNFPFSIKRREIALLRHLQGLHLRGTLLPEIKNLCSRGSIVKVSVVVYPRRMGALSRAKTTRVHFHVACSCPETEGVGRIGRITDGRVDAAI